MALVGHQFRLGINGMPKATLSTEWRFTAGIPPAQRPLISDQFRLGIRSVSLEARGCHAAAAQPGLQRGRDKVLRRKATRKAGCMLDASGKQHMWKVRWWQGNQACSMAVAKTCKTMCDMLGWLDSANCHPAATNTTA